MHQFNNCCSAIKSEWTEWTEWTEAPRSRPSAPRSLEHEMLPEMQFLLKYGYGSIPINTIFRGMNIHLPAICLTLPYVSHGLVLLGRDWNLSDQVYRIQGFFSPRLHLGSFTVCAFTFWNKNLATRPERVLFYVFLCLYGPAKLSN